MPRRSLGLLFSSLSSLIILLLGSSSWSVRAMSTSTTATTTGGGGSTTKPSAALVFLHGLGDTPAGWSDLERTLPSLRPRLADDVLYAFPAAPTIPVSINGGAEMPGWFDLYDWPVAVGVRDDVDGAYRAVRRIEQIITDVETRHGVPRSRIVVGGFSQGGAIALLTAYHASDELSPRRSPLAGCVALSGWWTLHDKPPNGSKVVNPETPLFWAHGRLDDKVLFEQQRFGVRALREAGVTAVESHQYPMGHASEPREIEALAAFLDKLWFDGDEAEKEL